jgi:S-adenosylmethionine:diacylglycerol 3-amino-3-carboxypropyl transferase
MMTRSTIPFATISFLSQSNNWYFTEELPQLSAIMIISILPHEKRNWVLLSIKKQGYQSNQQNKTVFDIYRRAILNSILFYVERHGNFPVCEVFAPSSQRTMQGPNRTTLLRMLIQKP